jgi:hypothetical protein
MTKVSVWVRLLEFTKCGRGLVCNACNFIIGAYENGPHELSIDILDKYLANSHFIFSNPLRSERFKPIRLDETYVRVP